MNCSEQRNKTVAVPGYYQTRLLLYYSEIVKQATFQIHLSFFLSFFYEITYEIEYCLLIRPTNDKRNAAFEKNFKSTEEETLIKVNN